MHKQCHQLIQWLCTTLASGSHVVEKNPAFLGLFWGFCTVLAAGKWTAAFSVCCQPLNWITLMFYPSLFPACNGINATLICITLLLNLGRAEWMWHCLTAGHAREKQHFDLESHRVRALTDLLMDLINFLSGMLKLLQKFSQFFPLHLSTHGFIICPLVSNVLP